MTGRKRGGDRLTAARNRRWEEFAPPLYSRALVVFSGGTGVAWLRWLRPGFRHCFVAVDDGIEWLTVDPLLHRLEDDGLIRSSWDDSTGRNRKWYDLTAAGKKRLSTQAQEWADYAECIRQLLAIAQVQPRTA